MATILNFRQKPVANPRPRRGEPCEVVFFTGVRYEHSATADARRTDQTPKERAPDLHANLPG